MGQPLRELYRLLKKQAERRSKEEVSTIAESVQGVSFFQNLGADVRQRCCALLQYQYFKAGATIFEEGSVGSLFYVVLEGTVGIYVNEVAAKELTDPEEAARLAALLEQRRRNSLERQRKLEEGLRQRMASATEQGMLLGRGARRVVVKTPSEGSSDSSSSESSEDDEDDCAGEASKADLGNLLAHARRATTFGRRRTRCMSICETRPGRARPLAAGPPPEGLREVARLGQGGAFGEVALMTDQPRTATVRALAAVHCAVLERRDYQRILASAFKEDRQGRLDFLGRVPFFAGWGAQELERLSSVMYRREMRRGEVLYEAGSSTVQVYFVQEGEFAVCRRTDAVSEEAAADGAPPPAPEPTDKGSSDSGGPPAVTGAVADSSMSPCSSRRRISVAPHLAVALEEGQQLNSPTAVGSPTSSRPAPAPATGCARRAKGERWATVALVTPPHALGLMDYICGAKVHCERVLCRSYKGCVYGMYAKELVSHLDLQTRAQMQKGALSQDVFLKRRTRLMGELMAAQGPGVRAARAPRIGAVRGTPSVYTPGGRLQVIAAADDGFDGATTSVDWEQQDADEALALAGRAGMPIAWRAILHGAAAWPALQGCRARPPPTTAVRAETLTPTPHQMRRQLGAQSRAPSRAALGVGRCQTASSSRSGDGAGACGISDLGSSVSSTAAGKADGAEEPQAPAAEAPPASASGSQALVPRSEEPPPVAALPRLLGAERREGGEGAAGGRCFSPPAKPLEAKAPAEPAAPVEPAPAAEPALPLAHAPAPSSALPPPLVARWPLAVAAAALAGAYLPGSGDFAAKIAEATVPAVDAVGGSERAPGLPPAVAKPLADGAAQWKEAISAAEGLFSPRLLLLAKLSPRAAPCGEAFGSDRAPRSHAAAGDKASPAWRGIHKGKDLVELSSIYALKRKA